MHNEADQFAKNILRDALSRASYAETEVEVLAATQRIDVYSVPDPTREAERASMGLLGELSAAPSLFEPFRRAPGLREVRACLRKQLTWHHELERRARSALSPASAATTLDEAPSRVVPFPALIIITSGRSEAVMNAFGWTPLHPGVYDAVPGLVMRLVVLGELPRTRATLLLRLLSFGRVLREALVDLAALPSDAWEKSIASPLLVHFRLVHHDVATKEEDDVSAEIQAWFEDYQRKVREEARTEGRNEGRREGERGMLLRLLRARFGELPSAVLVRVEAAEVTDIERWSERVLTAQALAEVFNDPS